MVRLMIGLFLLGVSMSAQTSSPSPANSPSALETPEAATKPNTVTVPAGTKLALELKHAISTKGTEEGAAVYAETTFPFVLNDRILIPAGTYVQGRISHIERGGRIKGRAEVQMHFTTLIYPNGYTVVLPGSLDNAPGVDKTSMKDKEGTLQQDSQAGDEATKISTRE
jgi:type IV secretory pathway VirB10-like protein